MSYSRNPLKIQPARFVVAGTRGRGMMMLYPDELVAVITPVDTWGYLVGPLIYVAISVPLFHKFGYAGVAAGAAIGGWIGNILNRRRAISKVAAGGDGITAIPLDLITGVRSGKREGVGGFLGVRLLVVTTADGTEYEFRGTMNKWQDHLAGILTARGRQIHTAADGITVSPGATPEVG